jgi:hypothetical protein
VAGRDASAALTGVADAADPGPTGAVAGEDDNPALTGAVDAGDLGPTGAVAGEDDSPALTDVVDAADAGPTGAVVREDGSATPAGVATIDGRRSVTADGYDVLTASIRLAKVAPVAGEAAGVAILNGVPTMAGPLEPGDPGPASGTPDQVIAVTTDPPPTSKPGLPASAIAPAGSAITDDVPDPTL